MVKVDNLKKLIKISSAISILVFTACQGNKDVSEDTLGITGSSESSEVSSSKEDENQSMADEREVLEENIFPKSTCGDTAPDDPGQYPVTFYPVVITNTSEETLRNVREYFCEDAYEKVDNQTGEAIIQVASFVSQENASDFISRLDKDISSGKVGAPVIIEALPGTNPINSSASGRDPKLSESQRNLLKQIMLMEDPQGGENEVSIIVPFEIPQGYQVESIEQTVDGFSPKGYEIVYKDSNNSCFAVRGQFVPFTSPHAEGPFMQIEKGLFKGVFMSYEEYDNISDSFIVKMKALSHYAENSNGWEYEVRSPSSYGERCGSVSPNQFAEIVESMDHLFPSPISWRFTSQYRPY